MRTAALALVCVASLGAQGLEAPRVTVADIEKAWREREEAFQEVEVEWEEELHLPKGVISKGWSRVLPPPVLKRMNPDGATIPSQDETHKVRGLLRANGGKMALERDEPQWAPSKKSLQPTPIRAVYDGKLSKTFRPMGLGDADLPQGQIAAQGVFQEIGSPYYRPLGHAVRPLMPSYRQIPLENLVVTGRTLLIRGSNCCEVQELNVGKGRAVVTHWVDPVKGCALCRSTVHQGGRIVQQLDIEHAQRPNGHWMPIAWEVVTNDAKGGHMESVKAKVAAWLERISGSLDVVFPVGALIVDTTLPNDEQAYVVRAGGRFPVTPERSMKSHRDLLDEMKLEDEARSSAWQFWAWMSAFTAILVVLAIYFMMRARRAKPFRGKG